MIGAFALSEPRAGTNAGNLCMRAQAFDGGYRLNGVEQSITSAAVARATTTCAMTDRSRGKRYGLQAMCEGGGIANVTIVEAL